MSATAPSIRAAAGRRRAFSLDTALPADPAVLEAQILRLLSEAAPAIIAIRPSNSPERAPRDGHRTPPPFVKGVPDLILLLPRGRTACLRIKTQADRLSREQVMFGDLCRQRGIPFAVVRSAPEARDALIRFGVAPGEA